MCMFKDECDNAVERCDNYSPTYKAKCGLFASLTCESGTVAKSAAGMAGPTARCDEAAHVLIKFASVEHGKTATGALELAAEINKAAFLADHKAERFDPTCQQADRSGRSPKRDGLLTGELTLLKT